MEWMGEQYLQEKAGRQADEIIERIGLTAPINPIEVAESESTLLRVRGANLGDRYDGKLEYNRPRQLFLLFYNTKYDDNARPGKNHPRTKFSVSHELGHFFLDDHHAYLRGGGQSHRSITEFRSLAQIEREADSFAASLLLPTKFVKPVVNREQLSVARLIEIATDFETSLIATAFRSVRLSHFPCAIAGIRQGSVAWMFLSDAMFQNNLYPRRHHLPPNAVRPYAEFQMGLLTQHKDEGKARDWFTIYDEDRIDDLYVTEEYIPVKYMETLAVLLTIEENDFEEEDEDWEDGE